MSVVIVMLIVPSATAGARRDHTDAVLAWNAIMVATVGAQNPFAQGRFAAITQLAVFEAVNAITRRYTPYLGTIAAPRDASPDAAAIAAAHSVLRTYFPAAAATLDAARLTSLSAIPDGPAKEAGIAVGTAAAAAMIAHRASDGSTPPEFHLPSSAAPGEWLPTPSCPPAGGVLKHWRNVVPFGITDAAQFRSTPPPPLHSQRYARDFAEVKEGGAVVSSTRTPHQTDAARFYNVVLAVATWNPAVRQAAAVRGRTLSQNARIFALLNMAINDGLVAVMETKYEYTFWRPETAIHRAAEDGNPRTDADPVFQPLIPAPCFPSYGSAHAAASYAAREIAETFFGDDHDQEIVLASPALPDLILDYGSFEAITEDIDDARVYGGIHFRFDQRAGARQGRRIGSWIYRHHLRPITDGGK
jgi:hypothetical protein